MLVAEEEEELKARRSLPGGVGESSAGMHRGVTVAERAAGDLEGRG